MMKIVIFFCLTFATFSNGVDYDGWLNIKIHHNLNCNSDIFCDRGTISLRSLRSGSAVIDQKPFTKDHIEHLKDLAGKDAFYTVKTTVTSAENKELSFLSSVKAQAFLDNSLTDIINAWVLPNGAIAAVSFQVANFSEPLDRKAEEYSINSEFYLRQVDQAPVPDTASYVQKLVREKEAKEKGETKDNRSFFAKYWMYIVPVVIFLLISGAANPDGAQGGGR